MIRGARGLSHLHRPVSTKNRGHQTALTEGLMAARAERAVSVSIDADLQDDGTP